MPQSLPARPNLEQLKKQAKALQKSFNSGEAAARRKVEQLLPKRSVRARGKIRLVDAQLAIAREYGFVNWPGLKQRVERLTVENAPLDVLIQAVLANDSNGARKVLTEHPGLGRRLDEPIPDHGFGATLLLAAVQRTNQEMIDLLLNAGADINARSHWWAGGFGVLDNDHGLAAFLIQRGARVDAHAAARLGMLNELEQVISDHPAAVHARGGDGQTPLHFASNIAIAECLLKHGASIDALDVDHESTPAQYLIRDRQEVARHLVARGCRTDIFMAAALGDLDLVRKHLEADPDCIHLSVSEECFPKRNPRAGGTIYIWTLGQHKTPHQVARDFGHEQVYRFLMARSPRELQLSQACEVGDQTALHALLASAAGSRPTLSERESGRICYAAQNNNANAVRLMLEAGWPVNARGQHGTTPLHWAAFHGNPEMAKVILQYHPPLECTDADFGGTPLGWAVYGSEHGWFAATGRYPETVEALLQAGSKIPEKTGGTPAVQAVLGRFARQEQG